MRAAPLIVLSLMLSAAAVAQGDEAEAGTALTAGTAWSQPFLTRLDITFAGGSFHARWDISRCDCGDLYIRAEETLPQEIRHGEQLLLDNTALLVRGYDGHEGALSALLDSPALMMQLLFVLLQKAAPAGPPAVHATLNTDISEASVPIELDSGSAFGFFPAPWSLSGSIEPGTAGRFRYELKFEFSYRAEINVSSRERILLSGFVDYTAQPFPVAGSELLDEWSLEWLQKNIAQRPGLEPGMSLDQFRKLVKKVGSE